MAANKKLLILAGDGIGPEVMREARRVLDWMERRRRASFDLSDDLVGGASLDARGTPISDATMQAAKEADAILFGAVGGPKWDDPRAPTRPEQAILNLRAALATFANLRPARLHPALVHLSPLKAEVVQGADVLFVRELVAGTYFARPKKDRKSTRLNSSHRL